MWIADGTRPRQRWSDRDREDLKPLGVRDGERLALGRNAWRDIEEAT